MTGRKGSEQSKYGRQGCQNLAILVTVCVFCKKIQVLPTYTFLKYKMNKAQYYSFRAQIPTYAIFLPDILLYVLTFLGKYGHENCRKKLLFLEPSQVRKFWLYIRIN